MPGRPLCTGGQQRGHQVLHIALEVAHLRVLFEDFLAIALEDTQQIFDVITLDGPDYPRPG